MALPRKILILGPHDVLRSHFQEYWIC